MKSFYFSRSYVLLLFFLVVYISISYAQTRYLIPYREGKLWGYADTNLKIIVTPQYDVADAFWYGYAMVRKGKLFGVVNGEGNEIVPPIYDHLENCCYSYVTATKGANKGLIELPSGKIILPAKYKDLRTIDDFYCIVTSHNSVSGVINLKTGRWIFPMAYSVNSEQYPWYSATNSKRTIYFKIENGKLITGFPTKPEQKQIIVDATPPVEEMLETSDSSFYYQMPSYDNIEVPRGMGWLYIVRKNGKSGVYSIEKYKEIVPLIYDKVEAVPNSHFKEFFIVTNEGKAGVVTNGNKVVVPLVYEEIRFVDSSAYDSVYIAKFDGKYGIIKADQQLLPFRYDNIYGWFSVKNGFVLYQKNKTGAFLFRRNKFLPDILVEPKYDAISSFRMLQLNNFNPSMPYMQEGNGKIIVEVYQDGKNGFVDLNGKEFFKN